MISLTTPGNGLLKTVDDDEDDVDGVKIAISIFSFSQKKKTTLALRINSELLGTSQTYI